MSGGRCGGGEREYYESIYCGSETLHRRLRGIPEDAKREVLAEIRLSRDLDYPGVSDRELVSVADQLFAEYDRREAGE